MKGRGEAEALWKLLAAGGVDFVASDHAPAPPEEKNTGNPWTAYGGIPGTGVIESILNTSRTWLRSIARDTVSNVTMQIRKVPADSAEPASP